MCSRYLFVLTIIYLVTEVNPIATEIDPIGIISVIGTKHTQNEKLIRDIINDVKFEPASDSAEIQVWTNPIDVIDKYGTSVKGFIMNCKYDENETIQNRFTTVCMLLSSYIIVNLSSNIEYECKHEISKIDSLIRFLKSNELYKSQNELIGMLPSVIWVSRKSESSTDGPKISTRSSFDKILRTHIGENELILDDTQAYVKNIDYFCLPDHNSSTPFCEDIQDIRRKV